MDWVRGRCEANGTELGYLRTGGDKPPVVLLHGLTGSGACWTPVARALQDDFDVVMPDARGHGTSGASAGGYRYDDLAADAVGLIDALGLGAPVFVGHSMGGMTAAVVARRNPRRLRALVLVDPTFLSPPRQREVFESDVAAEHRRVLEQSREALRSDLRRRHAHRSPEMLDLLVEARFQTDVRAFEILAPPNPDYRELVEALAAPGLLVVGDAGAVVTREVASELAQINPSLRVEEVAGAGHGLPYDQPERLAAAVRDFLNELHRVARSDGARG